MTTRFLSGSLVVLSLSFTGAGCGGSDDDGGGPPVGDGVCANETRGQKYAAGLAYDGEEGLRVTLVASDPAPPRVGEHTWTLEITDASGAPVTGATLEVEPLMVQHGHGSQPVVVTDLSGGRYSAAPVDLGMPGFWDTTIRVTANSVTDEVNVGFCVE